MPKRDQQLNQEDAPDIDSSEPNTPEKEEPREQPKLSRENSIEPPVAQAVSKGKKSTSATGHSSSGKKTNKYVENAWHLLQSCLLAYYSIIPGTLFSDLMNYVCFVLLFTCIIYALKCYTTCIAVWA